MAKIDLQKCYKLSETLKLSPILEKKGYIWVWKQVMAGKIKAINTNPTGRPSYLITGATLTRFLEGLTSKK